MEHDERICNRCNRSDLQHVLLICDGCSVGSAHTHCLGLSGIPRGNWYCDDCISGKSFEEIQADERRTAIEEQTWKFIETMGLDDSCFEELFRNLSITAEKSKKAVPPPLAAPARVLPPPVVMAPVVVQPPPEPPFNPFNGNRKITVYLRVSTKDQDDPLHGRAGLQTQSREISEFCGKNRLILDKTVRHVGTGTVNNVNMKRLVGTLRTRGIVIVYNVSRFMRNTAHAIDMLARIHDRGGRVYSVQEGIFSTMEKDPRTADISPEFIRKCEEAEADAVRLSKTIIDAKKRLRAEGLHAGGLAPYGKVSVREERGCVLVDCPAEQKIIEMIVRMFREKKSALEIANNFCDRGILRRGKMWKQAAVARIVNEKIPGDEREKIDESAGRRKRKHKKIVIDVDDMDDNQHVYDDAAVPLGPVPIVRAVSAPPITRCLRHVANIFASKEPDKTTGKPMKRAPSPSISDEEYSDDWTGEA